MKGKVIISLLIALSCLCAFAQGTEQDEFYRDAPYYGLGFFVQMFPDQITVRGDETTFRSKFLFGEYVINYRLLVENGNFHATLVVIGGYVYADFFDGLEEADYVPEQSGNKPLDPEKFDEHRKVFGDLAEAVSDFYPDVSKLVFTIEYVKTIIGMTEEYELDRESLEKVGSELERVREIQDTLITRIREEKPMFQVYSSWWIVIIKSVEDGDVHFEIHELPWDGIEPPGKEGEGNKTALERLRLKGGDRHVFGPSLCMAS